VCGKFQFYALVRRKEPQKLDRRTRGGEESLAAVNHRRE